MQSGRVRTQAVGSVETASQIIGRGGRQLGRPPDGRQQGNGARPQQRANEHPDPDAIAVAGANPVPVARAAPVVDLAAHGDDHEIEAAENVQALPEPQRPLVPLVAAARADDEEVPVAPQEQNNRAAAEIAN
ncbi:hypothetical protein QAD02_021111 [Eretmocerus hayati]|uniref:Uncharacterized protein n=1 Tax=Eretmocerus hayati TaxID=131215 RepID=A0ACC2PQM8_9HYME|nr:hypothetical protein QAD02_021111 [Eretmocerus hayati]